MVQIRRSPYNLTTSSLQRVVKVIDTNFDGKISKNELAELFFTNGQISPFEDQPIPGGSGT